MPDRERARLLANASLGLILVLLYGLGGVSLYLRSRYLAVETPQVAATATATMPQRVMAVEATALPTLTLYPTLTPYGLNGASAQPTRTPSP